MGASREIDPLLNIVEQIKTYAPEHSFVVFYGWASGEKVETVHWNEERDSDWHHFLDAAKSLSVKLVYLNWAPFEEFQIEEALLDEEVASSRSMSAEEIEKHNREIAKFSQKVGLTAIVDLAYLFDGVLHIFQKRADWFEAFEELTARGEIEEETKRVEEKVDTELVDTWANKLVRDSRYRMCKTYSQQDYLLEKLAGDEYKRLPVSRILSRADTIYLIDIRPQEDEELRKQAKELKVQGLNLNAIAQRLGLSRDRVSGLLSA